MARRRILFVTDVTPLPLSSGQRVRVRHLLAACRRVADVTLVAPPPDDPAKRRQIEGECARVVWVGDTPLERGWRGVKLTAATAATMAGLPFPSNVALYRPFVAAIDQADPAGADLIWAERPHIAKLCAAFAGKTIVDLDDLDHVKHARQRSELSGWRDRAKAAYRAAYYRRLEIKWARRLFASVVCSEEDRAYLVRHGCANAIAVPNGADLPTHAPRRTLTGATPPRIVFLGNMGYPPNADGLAYFVERILPPLLKAAPGATCDVIGPNASDAMRARFGQSVRFRGFADDLGAALADYDSMAVPLRVGGGTKLKVLDAMACALPVVTTSIGAEGLSLTHRAEAWIADTPEAFVEGLLALNRDPELAARMAANARAHVAARFSWPVIEERLARWLAEALPTQ